MQRRVKVSDGRISEVLFPLPFPDREDRIVWIWTPPGYDPTREKPYAVLYMHDGQNLFDATHAYSGEWEIDETISEYVRQGIEGVIVVGIRNGDEHRLNEYSPSWPIKTKKLTISPKGEKYASFLVNTVVPYVDSRYNTDKRALNRGVAGSSMGGIISFYLALTYPETFNAALIFSPSFWLYENTAVKAFIKDRHDLSALRLYFYHGTAEGDYSYTSWMKKALKEKGIKEDNLKTVITEGGTHHEIAWLIAFKAAFPWLF